MRALLKRVGLGAADDAAIARAFVHQSATRDGGDPSNQRLEFLGDAILGAIVAAWLFEQYPQEEEGELTRRKAALVTDPVLAESARGLGFAPLMLLGRGLEAAGGADQQTVLADAFEAFVGALFVHHGLEIASSFVVREHLERIEHEGLSAADPKTALQELTQRLYRVMPVYADELVEGPPHKRWFTSSVSINNEVLGRGSGPSKKAAERDAAAAALALVVLRENEPGATVPCG